MAFNAGTFAMLTIDLLELDAENVRQVRDVAAFLKSQSQAHWRTYCSALLESSQADPAAKDAASPQPTSRPNHGIDG